jgi:hypothetical protein
MGKLRDQLASVRFHCDDCDERFETEPARIEDAPDDAHHPWRYFAPCPICRKESPQDRQHRHLLKMWANATGPKTDEGKAAVSANLEGHPTQEESRRTRFNALKHGLHAKTATYWPAKPGQYPHCRGCEYLDNICWKQVACLKRTELLLKHQIAFETGDPGLLVDLRAQLHANVQALLDDMILALAQDGVRLKTPEWYYSADGKLHFVNWTDEAGVQHQLHKIEQHPLLRTLGDLIAKLNLGLADQGMTPKVQDDNDVIRGHLAGDAKTKEQALDYQHRQTALLEGLGALIMRSREKAAADPVLLEHSQGSAET